MSFNELFSIHYESDSSNESLIKIISRELNIFLEITVFLKSQFWCRAEYRKGFSSDLIIFSLPRTVPVSKIVKNGPLNLFYSYDTLWLARNILERPKLFKKYFTHFNINEWRIEIEYQRCQITTYKDRRKRLVFFISFCKPVRIFLYLNTPSTVWKCIFFGLIWVWVGLKVPLTA